MKDELLKNKSSLMDMDYKLVVTRWWGMGKVGGGRQGKGGQICGDRKKSNYGR